jgi:thioredoxin 2
MNHLLVKCPGCGVKNKIPADKQHLGPKCGRCGSSLDLSRAAVPLELTDADFQSFISKAGPPVMVALLSPSCGYCRRMTPILDDLAKQFAKRFLVAKLDTSRNHLTPSRFHIRGVPTLLFFKGGKQVDRLDGAAGKEMLAQKVAEVLAR